MTQTAIPEDLSQTRAAKRSAALSSLLAALGITLLKLLTGLLTGSLGMLSDAAHSTIDLVAAGITLFSVGLADRPADDTHNYAPDAVAGFNVNSIGATIAGVGT